LRRGLHGNAWAAMREKFLMLTRRLGDAEQVLERLQRLEEEDSLEWLGA